MTVSLLAQSQNVNLDTVRVRNLQLKTIDWLYLVSYLNGANDSTTLFFTRKITNKVKTTPNVQMSTDVTIDSLPGRMVLFFYLKSQDVPTGEGREIGNRIYNNIRLVPQLAYEIGVSDAGFSNEYMRHWKIGKHMVLDN